MRDPLVVNPPMPRHRLYHLLGTAALAGNRIRRLGRPYRRARHFSSHEILRTVAYDLVVVDGWERALFNYAGASAGLGDRCIAEIGPGPALGTGVVALWRGARRYVALDSRPLARRPPPRLYQALLERLNEGQPAPEKVAMIQRQLALLADGKPDRLAYVVGPQAGAAADRCDLVVSQAVLEHVRDLEGLLERLGGAVRDDALFVAEVDFMTHTRPLRTLDPLNIYRFGPWFYGACRFDGAPTRRRPGEYLQALRLAGWTDAQLFPKAVLREDYVRRVRPRLARAFQDPAARMEILSAVICARRGMPNSRKTS